MPRNTKKNVEDFKEWFENVLGGVADVNENLMDIYNRPGELAFMAKDKFKCNINRPNHYIFVQDAILKRLIYLNDKKTLEQLNDIVKKDRVHYRLSKIIKAEELLQEIYDDTEELLELSRRLSCWEADFDLPPRKRHRKLERGKRKICYVDYDDKEKRTFKMK